FFHIDPGLLEVVLRKFYRLTDSRITAGNYADDLIKRHAESWRTLGSIYYAEATTGARSYIKQTSACFHLFDGDRYQTLELVDSFGHCQRDGTVFVIDVRQ